MVRVGVVVVVVLASSSTVFMLCRPFLVFFSFFPFSCPLNFFKTATHCDEYNMDYLDIAGLDELIQICYRTVYTTFCGSRSTYTVLVGPTLNSGDCLFLSTQDMTKLIVTVRLEFKILRFLKF